MKTPTFAAVVGSQLLFSVASYAQPPVLPQQPTVIKAGELNAIIIADGPKREIEINAIEFSIREFVAALNAYDIKRASRYVLGASPASAPLLAETFDAWRKIHLKTEIKNLSVTQAGNRATAHMTVSMTADPPEPNFHFTELVMLANDGTQWRILAEDPDVMSRIPDGPEGESLIRGIAGILAHPEEFTDEAICLLNLKRLAWAMHEFATDEDAVDGAGEGVAGVVNFEKFAGVQPEKIPAHLPQFTRSLLRHTLQSYVKFDTTFVCPAQHNQAPDAPDSYSYNANLNKAVYAPWVTAPVPRRRISRPEKTVMIYEGKDGKLNFRHDGRAAVAFVDGHVELIDKEQAKTLRWTP